MYHSIHEYTDHPMSLKHKLLLGFLAITGLVLAVGLIGLASLSGLERELDANRNSAIASLEDNARHFEAATLIHSLVGQNRQRQECAQASSIEETTALMNEINQRS